MSRAGKLTEQGTVGLDRLLSARRWAAGLLVAGMLLASVPAAQAFHRHRVIVRPPVGISYWGSAYGTRAYYHAYRAPVYRGHSYVARPYWGPSVAYRYRVHPGHAVYRSYYRSYYRPWPVGVYGFGYVDPCFTGVPVGVVPWNWFGADLNAADPDLLAGPLDAVPDPVAAPWGGQQLPAAARIAGAGGVLPPQAPGQRVAAPGGAPPVAGGRLPLVLARSSAPVAGRAPLAGRLAGAVDAARSGGLPGAVSRLVDLATSGRVTEVPSEALETVRQVSAARAATRPLESTEAGRRRADKYVAQGDELFMRGRYLEAASVYQRAEQAAPDLAEPLVRQSFAYVAAERYERAAETLRRGIELEPDYVRGGFRLRQLYGIDTPTKGRHVEQLAAAALDHPDEPTHLFLVGAFLHFDGQPDRAARFFARAKELAGPEATTVAVFQAAAPLQR